MKQLQRRITTAIMGSLLTAAVLFAPAPVDAISVTPQPPELPAAPVLLTGYRVVNGVPEYTQLYNTSSDLVNLDGWTLTITLRYEADRGTGALAELIVPIKLSGYVKPSSYIVIANGGSVTNADMEFNLPADFPSLGVQKLTITNPSYTSNDKASAFNEAIRYDLSKSSAGNYTTTSAFRPTDANALLYGGGLYVVPAAPPVRITAIAANAKQCGPFQRDPACFEYVTLQSLAAEPFSLDDYRLRIGYGNQSPSIDSAIPLTGELAPGQFLSVTMRSDGKPLAITASGGFVWIEDIYGLEKYKSTEVSYQDIGDRNRKGQAWGFDSTSNTWRWALASLSTPNDFSVPEPDPAALTSTLKACAANQYRSLETNRCRLLTAATSPLVPCKSGQYRSTETNRCRSLGASSTSSLTPCKPGQFRNPETNRCKSAASTTSSLEPCAADQKRNPETNRCRKITSTPPAAKFSVEPIKQGAEEFAGWWALGGIVAAAGSYGAWEWRREISGAIAKVRGVFRGGK